MILTFIQLANFVREWNRFGLNDTDLRSLEMQLLSRPDAGPVMAQTGGLRKVRFAPPQRRGGKSGAFRVAYVYFPPSVVLFVSIFAKNEKANLTAAEKKRFRDVIQSFKH